MKELAEWISKRRIRGKPGINGMNEWQGKPKYSEINLRYCCCVHHRSHMTWPGLEPGPLRWEAVD
jgi:hypothetical protein